MVKKIYALERKKARELIKQEYRAKLKALDVVYGKPGRQYPYGLLKKTVCSVIEGMSENFMLANVVKKVRETMPQADSPSIAGSIHQLKKKGKVLEVVGRRGKVGALYRKR